MSEQNLVMVAEKLTDLLLQPENKVRDIYSLAIRSTLTELGDNEGANLIRTVYPKLVGGIKRDHKEVKEESFEILTEIFRKFGSLLQKNSNLVNKEELMQAIAKELRNPEAGVSKRATVCLGYFAGILSGQ